MKKKMKSQVSAFKISSLLNSLDLNETVQARQESVRVGKGEYSRSFTSDYFLNLEHAGVDAVMALVNSHFEGLTNALQFKLDYNIESREFSLTVRGKQRVPKAKNVSVVAA